MNPPTSSLLLEVVLSRFGRWLRWWAAFRGSAQWILAAIGVAVISGVVDYTFEPNQTWRTALLCLQIPLLLFLFWRWVASPFLVKWSPSALATAFERRVPAMNERLITAVEIREFPPAPALLERVQQEAGELARESLPRAMFSIRSTLRVATAAIFVAVVGAIVVATNAELSQTWWRRTVMLVQVRYPRETAIAVVGFRNGVRKVGRGRMFELTAKASGRIPERATLEFMNVRSIGQRRQIMAVSEAGDFSFRFRTVVQPIEFTIQAGDERTEAIRLEPVDPPAVLAVETTVEAPTYTMAPLKTQNWTNGPISAPVGSRLSIRLQFDRPIAEFAANLSGRNAEFERLSPIEYRISWEVVETKRLSVRFVNEDGVEGDEPFTLDVAAVSDRLPAFDKIEPSNVGPAVSRIAALPMAVSVGDDYGIEQAGFLLTRAGGATIRIPLAEIPGSTSAQRPVVELAPFGFKEGDRFTLAMEVSDLPSPDPFLGDSLARIWDRRAVRSPNFAFEVVAPDELQARLAAREINHRLRFEQTLRECRDARRTLSDAAKDSGATLQRLRVEEALQAIRKSANETRELAAAFFGLVEEFRNNRVGASGALERMERSVGTPLRRLAEDSFAKRTREIQSASSALGSPGFAGRLQEALAGLDSLIREGEMVLASMRKMEDFNELVSTLRTLRDEESKLLQETKEERKRRILDLIK